MTILFQRRQTTYPRSHTTEWDKTRARKRLAWCPLGHPCSCQSPSELCFTKDFTLKEARSYSDPLIPPPSTSSTQCRQGSTVNLPSPQDYMGLHSWLTDCYPRRESRKPRWQLSWPQVPSGGQAPQGLPSSLTPPPQLPSWLLTHPVLLPASLRSRPRLSLSGIHFPSCQWYSLQAL